MGLKSKIKIFWSEHRDPILFYLLLFIVIVLIVQGLNSIAKMMNIEENEINNNNINNQIGNEMIVTVKEDKTNRKLVEQFLDYCKNNKIEEAYNLISDECKEEKYKTLADFKANYYNKIFNKKRSVEVKKQKNNSYEVIFYEDMLETGKADENTSITDYYTIQDSIIEIKLNINTQNNIK